MPLKIPFWQVVTYMPTNVREPTYDVVKSAILNGKIITHLYPTDTVKHKYYEHAYYEFMLIWNPQHNPFKMIRKNEG